MRDNVQTGVEAVMDSITPEILSQCRYLYTAEVIKVVDGDTADIRLDVGDGFERELRCRFYGVNTPEISKPIDEGEREAGEAARDWLAAEIEANTFDGRCYVRTFQDGRGKFGRLLIEFLGFKESHVYSLNAELIRQGHAVPYLLGPKYVAPSWLLTAVADYDEHCEKGGDRWAYMRQQAATREAAE